MKKSVAMKKPVSEPKLLEDLCHLVIRIGKEYPAVLPEAIQALVEVVNSAHEQPGIVCPGCCTIQSGGNTYRVCMTNQDCNRKGGSWTPGPC